MRKDSPKRIDLILWELIQVGCHFHAWKVFSRKEVNLGKNRSDIDICVRNEGYNWFLGFLTFGQSTTIMAVDEKLFFLLQENCPQWNFSLSLNVFGDVIYNLRVEKLVQINQLGNIHKDSRAIIFFEWIQAWRIDKVLFQHVEYFQVFGLGFYEFF